MQLYDENTVPGPEYRVRTVIRYVVTRYCFPYAASDGSHEMNGGSSALGTFDDENIAWQVAEAMATAETTPKQATVGGVVPRREGANCP